MNDLDRRIAELVMGEEEPNFGLHLDSSTWRYVEKYDPKLNKVWYEMEPADFSSSLEEAMRAVDKHFETCCEGEDRGYPTPTLLMQYFPKPGAKPFMAYFDCLYGYGQTLPEAICNLLLALQTEHK